MIQSVGLFFIFLQKEDGPYEKYTSKNLFVTELVFGLIEINIWNIFVWQGTSYETLFSTTKIFIMFLIGTIDVMFSIFLIIKICIVDAEEAGRSADTSWSVYFENQGKLFVYITNIINDLFIYGTLIYYGLFKTSFRIKN